MKWSMPLQYAGVGIIPSAEAAGVLAVVDMLPRYDPDIGDSQLLILNPDTGIVLSKRVGKFTDLWPLADALGVLERGNGATEGELYICKLPDCAKERPVLLLAKEILKFRLYGEYITTAGIYDLACFERATGRRLWEKGQLEWSQPFDNEMVVTDFSAADQTARIVAIDLRNGKEQVLFSRKVTRHDNASFKPW